MRRHRLLKPLLIGLALCWAFPVSASVDPVATKKELQQIQNRIQDLQKDIKRTQSRRSLERCSALEFLGETRHEAALKILMPHLSDPTRPEWLSAARGLAMHRSSEAQKVLKSALKSVDAELRESVMSWLSERHLTLSMD